MVKLNDGMAESVTFADGVNDRYKLAYVAVHVTARTRARGLMPEGNVVEAAIEMEPLPLDAAGTVTVADVPPAATVAGCAVDELAGTLVAEGTGVGVGVGVPPPLGGVTPPPPPPPPHAARTAAVRSAKNTPRKRIQDPFR